jgi:hypothetical protein
MRRIGGRPVDYAILAGSMSWTRCCGLIPLPCLRSIAQQPSIEYPISGSSYVTK